MLVAIMPHIIVIAATKRGHTFQNRYFGNSAIGEEARGGKKKEGGVLTVPPRGELLQHQVAGDLEQLCGFPNL